MAGVLRTELCDVLGVDVPIIQAGMSVHTSPALVVAVAESGALGSLGAWGRRLSAVGDDIRRIRDETDRPFAVNYLPPDMDEESFASTLDAAVPVISFATGDPGDLVAPRTTPAAWSPSRSRRWRRRNRQPSGERT